MAERGAVPKVPAIQRKALDAMRGLFNPLLPDDYLELINPMWSTRELRGRIERIHRETDDTVTIEIRPGYDWHRHVPGQYLRIGVVVDGIHHWRAYSLTSDPDRPDGFISVTPKRVEEGVVSPFLTKVARPGDIVRLGGVEGVFVLPDPPPERILFVSAGSGLTPVMSMLRHLDRTDQLGDVVHIHSAHSSGDVIFADFLADMDERCDGYRLHLQLTGEDGRMKPKDLDELCSDWRERDAYCSGPGAMLDALEAHWRKDGDPGRFNYERFQPVIGSGEVVQGAGGMVTFCKQGIEAECDGATPILVVGEEAGAEMPFGCRLGICHTCTGTLRSGQIRDLRTGEVSGGQGETVRTCVNTAEGPVEIEL